MNDITEIAVTRYEDISLDGVKGVLLDLDDTLYDYNHCHVLAYKACGLIALKYNISVGDFDAAWKVGRDRVHKDLHHQGASHSRLLYAQKLYEHVFSKSNPGFALEMEQTYWDTFLDSMTLIAEAEAFLVRARTHNIKVCIVSDLTVQIQMKKWLRLDLGKYVDFLVTSEEAGVEKPAAYIFNLALEKMQMTVPDVIMIGDNAAKDVQGARSLNMRWYLVSLQANNSGHEAI